MPRSFPAFVCTTKVGPIARASIRVAAVLKRYEKQVPTFAKAAAWVALKSVYVLVVDPDTGATRKVRAG